MRPPAPQPETAPVPTPEPPTPDAPAGFTLQFESDAALRRLVARDAVALFAIDGDRAMRMSVRGGRVGFWRASMPESFHEMDAATVPADVVAAFRRVGGNDARPIWGVTLPADMQRQLDDVVRTHERGALFIAASGRVRLER